MVRCSVIIPVYNQAYATLNCLSHLGQDEAGAERAELILVDDGSSPAVCEALRRCEGRARIVRHAANLGFSRSCNDGAEAAAGDYLIFLNNDTMPRPGWLAALVRHAEAHPRAAVVGSKLLYPNETVQHAGIVIGLDRRPRHLYAGFPGDHPAVNRARRFQAVTAACALVRRESFRKVHGFDPAFRNGYEDVDLCLRLGAQGGEIHYCPESVAVHLESISEGRFAQDRENYQLYRRRWAERVQPDDVHHYLEDGLLSLDYAVAYPLRLRVEPLLAWVNGEERHTELAQLLDRRTQQVRDLLRENIRLALQWGEAELRSAGKMPRDLWRDREVPRDVSEEELQELLLQLQAMLAAHEEHAGPPPATAQARNRWLRYRLLTREIADVARAIVPADALLLCVSRGDAELVRLEGRQAWHFPSDGQGGYAGYHPKDSAEAIAHLEDLRTRGAKFLLVPAPSFWWLNHYLDFRRHLDQHAQRAWADDACVIYALDGAAPEGAP